MQVRNMEDMEHNPICHTVRDASSEIGRRSPPLPSTVRVRGRAGRVIDAIVMTAHLLSFAVAGMVARRLLPDLAAVRHALAEMGADFGTATIDFAGEGPFTFADEPPVITTRRTLPSTSATLGSWRSFRMTCPAG